MDSAPWDREMSGWLESPTPTPTTARSIADSEKTLDNKRRDEIRASVTYGEQSERPELPRLQFILLGTGIGCGLFLAMMDASIVATSLFAISAEFGTRLDTINWVALAYTLAYLGCAVLFSRLADVIGRKYAFLAAYVIFMGASMGSGFSQNLNELIAFRTVQGVGASGLFSIAMIIFPELASNEQKKFISSIVGIVMTVSGVLGPVLGGVFTKYTTWRWVFWINGPIGALSITTFLLTWPDDKYLPNIERRAWKDLDYLGSLLLVAGSVLVVFSFQNAGNDTDEWSRAIFIAPLVAGCVCLMLLFAWQRFAERRWSGRLAAAIPMVLLRNLVYTSGMLNMICLGFPYFLIIYAFPTRFQVINQKSSVEAGVMMLPMLASTAVGSIVAGAVTSKKNRYFEVLLASSLLMIIGCALETTANSDVAVQPQVLGFLAIFGFGFGLSAAASTMLASIEAPVHEHAPAQGMFVQARMLGGSIGIAASSAIIGAKTASLTAAAGASSEPLSAAGRQVYADAFRESMILCCAVLALGALCTLGVYRPNRMTVAEQHRERERREVERRKAEAMNKAMARAYSLTRAQRHTER